MGWQGASFPYSSVVGEQSDSMDIHLFTVVPFKLGTVYHLNMVIHRGF